MVNISIAFDCTNDLKFAPLEEIKPLKQNTSLAECESRQLCSDESDVVASETALRIIKIIEGKNLKPQEMSISNTFNCFSKGFPISLNKREQLIQFFNKSANKKLGQSLFSKSNLITNDNNRTFINSFLINSEGKNNITSFVDYVINKLENYNFLIDFEYDKIEEIESKNKSFEPGTRIFKYTKGLQKGIITTNSNKEVFSTEKTYDKLDYKRNGLFCGIKKEGTQSYVEYFKFIGNEFKILGRIDDVKDLPNLSDLEGNLIYSSVSGKKGLQKFETDENKDKSGTDTKMAEKLKAEYDSIEIKNGLVLASKSLEGKKQTLEIFGKDYTKLMIYEEIEDYKVVDGENIFRFKTETGYSYYQINNNGVISEMKYLQNVKTLIRPDRSAELFKKFENGEPVFVKYQGDVNCLLVKDGDSIIYNTLEGKNLKITNTLIGLDKKLYSTYDIDGVIYIFDIKNKKFYKSKVKFKPSKPRGFGDIKKSLEELELGKFDELQ